MQWKERALNLLGYFELESLAEQYPESLSGGERQRTAVIRSLTNDPDIILADEPTSSLDDENTDLLMNLLIIINEENDVAIVMTTTDLYKKLPTNTDFFFKKWKLKGDELRKKSQNVCRFT